MDLTGGGTSGRVTLNLDTVKVPLLASNNAFTGNNFFATVGIGTTSQGSLLTVGGASNWGQSEIVGPSSAEASMGFRPSNVFKGGSGDWLIGTNTNFSSPGGFVIENASAAYFNITANGNVGIGTTAPGADLSMSGGLTINGTGDTLLSAQYNGTSSFALNPNPSPSGNGWTLYDNASGSWTPGITQAAGSVQVAGNVSQPVSAGGLLKAAAFVNGITPPYNIVNCFNSTLSGAAATTPPCGITLTEEGGNQDFCLDFGFRIYKQRFVSATLATDGYYDFPSWTANSYCTETGDLNAVEFSANTSHGTNFWVLVF